MCNSNCSKSVFDNLGLKQRSHYYRNGLVNMSAMSEMYGRKLLLSNTKSRVRFEGQMLALVTCWLYPTRYRTLPYLVPLTVEDLSDSVWCCSMWGITSEKVLCCELLML